MKALAEQHPGWSFDGVNPSSDMLLLARQTTVADAHRIDLHQGDICAAPEGPFDGAVCLVVFHYIPLKERVSTRRGICRRLRSASRGRGGMLGGSGLHRDYAVLPGAQLPRGIAYRD
ncbi:class I SAM-dependent methyltransferase [Rhizobium lusitanum]|uniref:class I SAM-dependent methyltransferase n=1 Tax=Rhizobium lusitanum TaxID=293958 RepID=UPI00315AD0FB